AEPRGAFFPHAPSYKSTGLYQPPASLELSTHPLRRRLMRACLCGLAAALLLAPAVPALGGGAKPAPKKLLVITGSKGFRHECVNRRGQEYCLVERTLMELGKKSGAFEAVCTQNSREAITGENLKNFDAVFFYTTGELPLSETQKSELLGFIRSGKGFAGSHSATDTFYKWKEYGELIGAYF